MSEMAKRVADAFWSEHERWGTRRNKAAADAVQFEVFREDDSGACGEMSDLFGYPTPSSAHEALEQKRDAACGCAAIAAMRDPSEAMKQARNNEPVEHCWAMEGEFVTAESAGHIFQAMIDEAISRDR